jgi:hypothetical protein
MTDLVRRQAEFLFYQTEDGQTRVEVQFDGETAWLSLGQMAELFQRDKSVISRHIKNVFDEGELNPASTVAKSATVQQEGSREVTREVEYFNLNVIISVGYRMKSHLLRMGWAVQASHPGGRSRLWVDDGPKNSFWSDHLQLEEGASLSRRPKKTH